MQRTVDDELSLLETRLLRWIAKQQDPYRIDAVGRLVRGSAEVEAVITNTRTGRQGLWPRAWDVEVDVEVEPLPLFRQRPKVQQSLFN